MRNERRKINIIWFNSPFNLEVKSNIGKILFKLHDKYFPKSYELHKIFNRNTVKLNYSCSSNLETTIKRQNAWNFKASMQQHTLLIVKRVTVGKKANVHGMDFVKQKEWLTKQK